MNNKDLLKGKKISSLCFVQKEYLIKDDLYFPLSAVLSGYHS